MDNTQLETLPEASPPVSQVDAIMHLIERIARDPSIDVDKIERMVSMHRELRREEAKRHFNHTLASIQREIGPVFRDSKNASTNSRYAKLESISGAIDPIVSRHNMSISYGTEDSPLEGCYRVVADVALGAYEKRYFLDLPIDAVGIKGTTNKTPIHAMGSSISYARRYLKMMIFDIKLTDEDDDGQGSSRYADGRVSAPQRYDAETGEIQAPAPVREAVIGIEQMTDVIELIEFVGANEKKFCAAYKIDKVADLPQGLYKEAMDRLRRFGRQRGLDV